MLNIIGVVSHKIYNDSHNWNKIQRHLQGIWHNSNTSLDILTLHTEIMNLKNAALLSLMLPILLIKLFMA
jgi:Na+/glutamate symporter